MDEEGAASEEGSDGNEEHVTETEGKGIYCQKNGLHETDTGDATVTNITLLSVRDCSLGK